MRMCKTAEGEKAAAKAPSRAWYLANRERQLKKGAEYRAANKEKVNAAIKRCFDRYDPETIREYQRQYYLANSEKLKQRSREYGLARYSLPAVRQQRSDYAKKWRQENPHKHNAKNMKYHVSKITSIPSWLDDDDFWMFDEIYDLARIRSKMTGVPHHVDHVIPLRGRNVCGLHVPLNLQVIPAEDNLRKLNRFS
jgi:hypothetical protein